MPVPVAVLRAPFKHSQFSKLGLPDDTLTVKDLELLIKNTNFLISKGLHVPGFRLTHFGTEDRYKGRSLGWISGLELKDGRAEASSDFTESGREVIKGKEGRWVSSGVRRDFKLTGSADGPVLPGPYLDHVAILGDENPAQKGLTDLFTVELSDVKQAGREWFSVDQDTGEIVYLSETTEEQRKEIRQMAGEDTVTAAMFKELSEKVVTLTTNIAKLENEKTALQKQIDDQKARDETAQFSEHQADVKDRVKKVQKKARWGSDIAEAVIRVGELVFGDKKRADAFTAMLSEFEKGVLAPGGRMQLADGTAVATLSDDLSDDVLDDDSDDVAMFAEDGSNVTEQHLAQAAGNPKIAQGLNKVIAHKRRTTKNKQYNFSNLREDVRARRKR